MNVSLLLALALQIQVADAEAARRPQFLLATSERTVVPIDVARTPLLHQRLGLDLQGASLKEAIGEIARVSGLSIWYSDDLLPKSRRVHLKADNITVAAALTDVLLDTGLDVVFSRDGTASLVKRAPAVAPPAVGTITGVVTEAKTGAPVPQAQVSVSGTSLGRATREDGRYTIVGVPAGMRTVTVRRLGYDPQSREVSVVDGGSVTADFELVGATTRLAEIVTTVTGAQRRVEVGNTIASINADSLTQIAPVMSFGDLLQGRASGVFSLAENGTVGQAGRLRIRGLNSLGGVSNDPIVVMDGVRVETSAGGSVTGGLNAAPGGGTGRLADINPSEIASVEVVKGPAAATLYGTDAANGVIVITTKRGEAGRTRFTTFTDQGILEQRLDYADQYRDPFYAFGRSTATNAAQRCTLVQRAAGSCVLDSLATFNAMTSPDTRPFKNGARHEYGMQVSGGTVGGATYFLSGNYEQETGTQFMPQLDQDLISATQGRSVPEWQVRPNVAERVNLRANLTAPLGQRGSAVLSTGFVSNQTRISPAFSSGQVGYRDSNDGWRTSGAFNFRPAYSLARRGEDEVRRFYGSLATTHTPSEWLILRGTIGADLAANAFGDLLRRGEDPGNVTGSRTAQERSIARYSLDLGATGTHSFSSELNAKTSVGVQYNRRAQRGTRTAANNLPLGGETLAGGTVTGVGEATLTTAVAGGYVEEVLSLRDRLFVTGALRFDGATAFGEDFEVAIYPKASVSWVIADGEVGRRVPGRVSALRLRAAYGVSGVQPGPTDALAQVVVANGFTVAGTATGPVATLAAGNTNLRPERSRELESGLDVELWQSRMRVEFTAYQRTSTDALVSRPLAPDVAPTSSGVGASVVENLGSVQNRGLELQMSTELLQGSTIAAGFTATGAVNKNRLLRLAEGVVARNPLAETLNGQADVGYPLFSLWGFQIESFADANANRIIEATEVVLSTEPRFVGPLFPTREATLAPYLKLMGERLHLSGSMQYRGGFFRLNNARRIACFSAVASCREVNDASTPMPEQARAVATSILGRSGPYMDDGSFLLLRELSVGFAVPPKAVRAVRARGGTLVLAGRNLALLWKASSVPFESVLTSQDNAAGAGSVPSPGSATYWLLRVNLTF